MIKIALVDDHVMLRKSLGVLLGRMAGFDIVFQADNGLQCMEQLQSKPHPDIILLDITMPVIDGLETARLLKQEYPQIKILALSMIKNDIVVIRMLKNGARGYILKDCEPAELETALHDIHEYGYYYNEQFTQAMATKKWGFNKVILNAQELSFLRWACTEMTHKEIADEMKVSPRTIDGYRDSLFRKLDVNSRVGIAMYAIRNGLVQL